MGIEIPQDTSTPLRLVNGEWSDCLNLTDRGLAYGDGVFETMLWRAGKIPLLDRHLDRMLTGCQRLAIPFVPQKDLHKGLQRLLAALLARWRAGHIPANQAVVKIIVTRGSGGQGYVPPASDLTRPSYLLQALPLNHSVTHYTRGIGLAICAQRLSHSSLLAGLKHLNRLEYVMAAHSVTVQPEQTLLLQDCKDAVIETLHHNIFIVHQGRLHTPVLDFCGVLGVARTEIIERLAPTLALPVVERRLTLQEVLQAEEVLICNSVRGIWPVNSVADIPKTPGPVTRSLQRQSALLWEVPHAS